MRITAEGDEGKFLDYNSVIGYALISVAKTEDGGLDVHRDFCVQPSWPEEDKEITTDFLKKAESKLSELFPDEPAPESKIWVPA